MTLQAEERLLHPSEFEILDHLTRWPLYVCLTLWWERAHAHQTEITEIAGDKSSFASPHVTCVSRNCKDSSYLVRSCAFLRRENSQYQQVVVVCVPSEWFLSLTGFDADSTCSVGRKAAKKELASANDAERTAKIKRQSSSLMADGAVKALTPPTEDGPDATLKSCRLQKFSKDSAFVKCISEGKEAEYRGVMDSLVETCGLDHLQINWQDEGDGGGLQCHGRLVFLC